MSARGAPYLILGLLIIGVRAFLLFGGQTGVPGGRQALGYGGFQALLEDRGAETHVTRTTPRLEDLEGVARILIAPDISATQENGRLFAGDLQRKFDQAPTILIFPKWLSDGRRVALLPQAYLRAYGRRINKGLGGALWQKSIDDFDRIEDAPRTRPLVIYPQGGINLPSTFEPALLDGSYVLAAIWRRDTGPDALLIFDPDLISNHGLANGSNAETILPLVEGFIGGRPILFDRSIREPRPRLQNAPEPPEARPMDIPRLLRFPFAYIWIAFGLLMGLVFWAFLGRADRISAGPEGLAAPPSLYRRLSRFAQLWAARVPHDQIFARYEDMLVTLTAARLGLRGTQAAQRAGLVDYAESKGMPSPRFGIHTLETLADLRRHLHDL